MSSPNRRWAVPQDSADSLRAERLFRLAWRINRRKPGYMATLTALGDFVELPSRSDLKAGKEA